MSNYKLTHKQSLALKYMIEGKNVFLTGMGGVGKSKLLNLFKERCPTRNIGITSTTGVSALQLNGKTLHSFTGIGLGTGSIASLSTKINNTNYLKKRWLTLQTLVIDEISMLSPDLFDKLDEIARIVRFNDKPFGGIQLILSGDFLQLPAIDTAKFCFQGERWDDCIDYTIYLTDIFRQDDKEFQYHLNNIRLGRLEEDTVKYLEKHINADISNDIGIRPTKLYALNNSVDSINNKELKKLKSEEIYSYDREIIIYNKKNNDHKEKMIKYCTAPDVLNLAVGAQEMLIKNLDLEQGLCNGSRGIVTNFICDLPEVKFVNGEIRVIEHNTWVYEQDDIKIGEIVQIPLKLAWATSIHKSQGSTLDCVEIDLSNIFEYGQAYVALSRVKSSNGLSITGLDVNKIRAHPIAVEYYTNLEKNSNQKHTCCGGGGCGNCAYCCGECMICNFGRLELS